MRKENFTGENVHYYGHEGVRNREKAFALFASLLIHLAVFIAVLSDISCGFETQKEEPVLHASLVYLAARNQTDQGGMQRNGTPVKIVRKGGLSQDAPTEKIQPVQTLQTVKTVEATGLKANETASDRAKDAGHISFQSTAGTSMNEESKMDAYQDKSGNIHRGADAQPRGASSTTPGYLEHNHPIYPMAARIRGYEGLVLVAAEISTDGSVRSVRVEKSSGYAMLDRSALEAVKTWTFQPGTKMGQPVVMWVKVPVKFMLKGNHRGGVNGI